MEQLYPFPHKAFAAELKKYPNATEIVWCQDEPQNQGAWFFIQHNIHENMLDGQKLGYAGPCSLRIACGGLLAPAPGTAKGSGGCRLRQAQGFCPDQVRPETRIQNKTLTERICHGYRRSQSPQLSESVAEATMLTWKKKPGEAVAADEILIEIETDKVVLEVPAPRLACWLSWWWVGDGGTVVSDQVIAKIDTEGKAGAAAPAAPPQPQLRPAAAVAAVAAPAAGGSKGDVAMPAAAKLLADNNLSVGDVAGSGKDGRVTKGDVLAAVAGGAKPAVAPA